MVLVLSSKRSHACHRCCQLLPLLRTMCCTLPETSGSVYHSHTHYHQGIHMSSSCATEVPVPFV